MLIWHAAAGATPAPASPQPQLPPAAAQANRAYMDALSPANDMPALPAAPGSGQPASPEQGPLAIVPAPAGSPAPKRCLHSRSMPTSTQKTHRQGRCFAAGIDARQMLAMWVCGECNWLLRVLRGLHAGARGSARAGGPTRQRRWSTACSSGASACGAPSKT
jgi:hypothetical protein